jgi:flagellar export protein FliJ
MKPFRFPLESLRVLRKQKENTAQQHYANALAACGRAEVQLQEAVAELIAGWNSLNLELANGILVGKATEMRAWCKVLEIRCNERKTARDETRRAAEKAFREMLAAVRDREALDRFHDKSRRAHDRETQRDEQKNFDEMAVQSSGSNRLLQLAGRRN